MAVNVYFNISVDDIDAVMQTYTQIRIWRATARYGSYTELTGSGTRINLVAGTSTYTYYDVNGEPTYWYRSTFYNATGPTESFPSDARNFGSWGILTDNLQRRLMGEGSTLSLALLTDAVFDGSADTIPIPEDLSLMSDFALSWLIRRANRHALAILINEWVAKPNVSKGSVNVALGGPPAQLMQRVRDMDSEFANAKATELKIGGGEMWQSTDYDRTYGEIVGSPYEIDPLSGYDHTEYTDRRVESVFERVWRWG